MKHHELKIVSPYYENVLAGVKNFEIRKNDRDFKVGDKVILRHWNREHNCFTETKPYIVRTIGYITDYAQKEGYVVFSI